MFLCLKTQTPPKPNQTKPLLRPLGTRYKQGGFSWDELGLEHIFSFILKKLDFIFSNNVLFYKFAFGVQILL